MKLKILAALIVFAPFSVAHAQKATEPSEKTSKVSELKTSEQQHMLDRMHAINQEEIAAGGIAEKNASSEGVKDYGRMLKADHESSDKKVKKVAEDIKYALKEPGADKANTIKKLQSLHGKEFDTEFLKERVKSHEKAIAELSKAQKSAKNTEAAKLIDELLPELKKHFSKAESLQKTEVSH